MTSKANVSVNVSENIIKGEFDRSLFSRLIDQIRVWSDRRHAMRQLQAMPDRLLKDIGVQRFEISEAVKRPAGFSRFVTPATPVEKVENTVKAEVKAEIKEVKQAA